MKTALTQEEKVVTVMVQGRTNREWFYPPDFMQEGMAHLFVGYEASARLSELAKDYPAMVETRQKGKYKERRIRYEDLNGWWEQLPENLRAIFVRNDVRPTPGLVV